MDQASHTPSSTYLLSDLHLGAPNPEISLKREKHVVQWLKSIQSDCKALYLVGDVFDFWFEYRHAVPRGYIRFLGQLAEMRDADIPIYLFTGNHDMWYQDYLVEQLGVEIYRHPIIRELHGKTFYLAHGDGLGPGDTGYKILKKVVTHPLSRWLYARMHPNFGMGLALWLSQNGGNHDYQNMAPDMEFVCTEEDRMMIHTRDMITQHPEVDFYVYGHRHKLVNQPLDENRRIFIIGDWIKYFSFIRINDEGPQLLQFPPEKEIAPLQQPS